MPKSQEFHTVRGYQLLRHNQMLLTSALEDYLEMIYRYTVSEGYIRMNILSELLNVKPSSASKAVQKLAEQGLVDYKKYGIVFLTSKGKEIGKFLLQRHQIIEEFLKTIGITENILIETELIEHHISVETLKNIHLLNQFFAHRPDILNDFKKFKIDYKAENESDGNKE